MATVNQIEKVILRVAGNPASGPFKEYAREMAEAIVALDVPEQKAKRVVENRETR